MPVFRYRRQLHLNPTASVFVCQLHEDIRALIEDAAQHVYNDFWHNQTGNVCKQIPNHDEGDDEGDKGLLKLAATCQYIFQDKLKIGNVMDVSAMRWRNPADVGLHIDDKLLGATMCIMTLRCKYEGKQLDKDYAGGYDLHLAGPDKEKFKVRINRNEIYFLAGESRYTWKHSVKASVMALKDTLRLFLPNIDIPSALANTNVPSDMRVEG